MRNIARTFALAAFALLSLNAGAQEKKPGLDRPYGFLFIGDKVMAGYETSYLDWVMFLKYKLTEDDDIKSLKPWLPDSNQRNTDLFYNIIYKREFSAVSKFVKSTADYDYPVTGITRQQAEAYCEYLNETQEWKTTKVDGKKVRYKFNYRLPAPGEFTSANESALTTDEIKLVTRTGRNKEGCFLINFNTTPMCKSDSMGFKQMSHRLLRKASLNPNMLGFYNVQGNVAEMTSEEGKATGGSYIHPIEECQYGSINVYTKPEMWLGFRVVGDVVYEDTEN